MNLVNEQIMGLNQLHFMPKSKVLVIIVGDNFYNALKSLQEQIYTNFEVFCIPNNSLQHLEKKLKPDQISHASIIRKIEFALAETDAEYICILDGREALTANALLEYAKCIEEKNPDIIYANEAVQHRADSRRLDYLIKPLPSNIAFFQSLWIGMAVLWKRELLQNILKEAIQERLDLLHKELFILALAQNSKVVQLHQILLVRTGNRRICNYDHHALLLLQRSINLHTGWEGYIGWTSSYGVDCFELYSTQTNILDQTGFAIVEDNLERTLQLLSQLSISFRRNAIIIGLREEHQKSIQEYCASNGFTNVTLVERKQSYAVTLLQLVGLLQSPYQIILNDLVQWVNRMNIERLTKCFLKPEVMVAVPQVATEGDSPVLVYAGAGINNLALNGSYFKGRLQKSQGGQDTAWTNYIVSMLTPYCIAVRKDIWRELLPIHPTVITARHLANEISFLCLKKEIICEYCAQSSVWVSQSVRNFERKNPETGEIILSKIDEEPRLSGNYWHLLIDYSDLIERKKLEIPYLLRSYEQHLKTDFQAFGLKNITLNQKKRILVLTNELSLTGAPLVLVQAVKVLIQSGFAVLVASPEDGPLRATFLHMNVPVIIDPQIQHNFEYIKIAYDFNFVIVSTVVLWQCIEALSKTSVPVLWWIHDSRIGYENYLRYVMPETIGTNVRLYCGGDYAQEVVKEYRPLYPSSILLYGVEDFSQHMPQTVDRAYWGLPEDKMIFSNIGQITKRKGQDILVQAIQLLPEAILKKCIFVFVGTVIDRRIYKEIHALKEVYPQNIIYIEQMPYDLLKEFYREIDGVICSSIDDPLPAFVSEALLMSRLCICSSNTAFRSIITSGENGYLFESGNAEKLSTVICQVVENKEHLYIIKQNARKLYETTFTPEIFSENFTHVIRRMLV